MFYWVFLLGILANAASNEGGYAGWQKYITGPQVPVVQPQAIVTTSGNVQNAEALISGVGNAVLTRNTASDTVPSITLDFGFNVVGFVSIQFNGASNNTPGIRIAFSETLQYLTDLSDYSRSNMANPITPGSDQIAVASKPYVWKNTWGCQNGTQVCSDGLHGFKYMKIYLDALDSDSPITQKLGTVNISSISLTFSAFLATVDTYQGYFECSDAEITQYWYSAVYTNDLTTDFFRENDVDPRGAYNPGLDGKLVLFDGAKRDRDPYVGDVAVSGRTGYISHGNLTYSATRNVLADLADHQRDDGYIPSASVFNYTLLLFDYPLWWIIAVNDYYLHTADDDFLTQYFPSLERALNDFYPAHTNSTSNLISKPSGYGDYAFVGRDGEASYYNALYVWALQAGAECARWAGRNQTSDAWLARTIALSDAINSVFWDDTVGAYRNSVSSPTSHPQDANAIAVIAGIADYNRSISALNYLSNNTALPYGNAFMDDDSVVSGGSERVYAFMSTFDLRARMEVGDKLAALNEIRRLYGWMQKTDPTVTYWEGIGSGGSMYQGGFTSAAHGWSTGIVGILTHYILGFRFYSPGGYDWVLDMDPVENITWARGKYPAAYESFEAQWGMIDDKLTATVVAPKDTKGTMKLPRGLDFVQVTHNDRQVWKSGDDLQGELQSDNEGRLFMAGLGGGRHSITATYTKRR